MVKRWNNNIIIKLFQIKSTLGENQGRNKLLYLDSRLDTQVSLILLYPRRDSHHNVWHARHLTPLNMCCGMLSSSYHKRAAYERYVWERPHGWCSLFLERYRVIPKNITLFTILENSAIQLTHQLSTNKLLLNSNTWNH